MAGEEPREVVSSFDDTPDFVTTVGTGMESVEPGAGAEFSASTVERLRARLDEFDAVRTRGEVESRSVHLGGQSLR
jgi:hypothetical protein